MVPQCTSLWNVIIVNMVVIIVFLIVLMMAFRRLKTLSCKETKPQNDSQLLQDKKIEFGDLISCSSGRSSLTKKTRALTNEVKELLKVLRRMIESEDSSVTSIDIDKEE